MKELELEKKERDGAENGFLKDLLKDIDNFLEIPVRIDVIIGKRLATIREILNFEPGYILDLKRSGGESLMIYMSDVYFAKGEVTVIEDTFGVRVTEIIDPRKV